MKDFRGAGSMKKDKTEYRWIGKVQVYKGSVRVYIPKQLAEWSELDEFKVVELTFLGKGKIGMEGLKNHGK